jgi:hypothetical protein
MAITPEGPRHRADSVYPDIAVVAQGLCDLLGSKLVASAAGVTDPGQVRKWARGDLEPTQPAEQRLRFAYDLLHDVEAAEGRRVAQAWAMSANPRLDYGTPLKAIREDRFQDTAAAAKAMMEDAYDG